MSEITEHKTNECNEAITITADEPDEKYGNASHCYDVSLDAPYSACCEIIFQRGPIKEVGVNGITHEVLLAILIHRMRGFQSGLFACTENAAVLSLLNAALEILKARTAKRMARGVEGTNVV